MPGLLLVTNIRKILAPLNYKEKVKEYAEKADLSISAYIVKAIDEKIEREAGK